jgi:NADH dehydrogenase/NADH:ubiquinone oxidoreductase subunit G
MKITIDGIVCEASQGEFVKEVAERNGINIPSLCHHSALPGLAACRLCLVEARPAGSTVRTVASCVYPVSEGLEVATTSESIVRLRRIILKLLLDRAPAAEGRLHEYCEEYGIEASTASAGLVPQDPTEKCILCGLCVKACDELGTSAIATVMRGVDKQIQSAFDEAPADCIGCASCAKVCPTGKIDWHEEDDCRTIWEKKFKLEKCARCGKPFATKEEQAWLAAKQVNEHIDTTLCPRCRVREALAHTLLT